MNRRVLSCRRGPRHECPVCHRLLGVQQPWGLHVRYKDLESLVEGTIWLFCRCRHAVVRLDAERTQS
jgi:hypothetical protein